MRILLIVVYYPPSTTSAAQLVHDLARDYFRQGHEVTVLTPSTSAAGLNSISVEEGVTVVRIDAGEIKDANRVLRLWRESRISATIWRQARDWFESHPCDLIVYYSPTIFFGKLVSRLKVLWHCPAYLILRDIFPQWAVDAGQLREGGLLHRYLRRQERSQYDAADVIGVEARGDLRYFDNRRWKKKYCAEFLPNWGMSDVILPGASAWRSRLALEGKVVFLFGGNIGVAQDMDNVIRLASSLRARDDIFFLLVGAGSEVARLNQEIARLDLNNIRILPAMPEPEYMQCLSEFDVGLVSLDRRLQANNFPGKILGYMACSKPVLASINMGNDLAEIFNTADAGIVCTNGEDGRLRDAAVLLASDPMLRERMGKNAKALGDALFSVRGVSAQILSHFAPAGSEPRVRLEAELCEAEY
ncbi:MAG TPA: glycosyltransferase family 4 protein [Terracidiphilus sp.]|jgi:glycosyltransferase involved in cell wall biosynthesis|nr:glycosyltransferase family 4 protein [Terracidiphilus sp.]